MTVTQQFVSAAEPVVVPAIDEATARLMMLFSELDKVGLPGELTESRALLARAGEVVRECGEGRAVVRTLRDQLIAAVASGSCGVADAAAQLSAADVEAAGVDIVAGAVRSLRRQAVAAAKVDGMAVHRVLASRIADTVDIAVDAGRLLADVKAIAKVLSPPPFRASGPQRGPTPTVHPWVDSPPSLPEISLDTIAGDRRLVAAWAESTAASQEIGRLRQAAIALHAVCGGSSRFYAADLDDNVVVFFERLPAQIQLAVANELNWRPGLWPSLKPGAPQPPASLMENIVAGIRYPVGWMVGKRVAKDGPYGGGGRPRS